MNPLEALIVQLSQGAGKRGSTFAGRVIPQGETPTPEALLAKTPTDVPDAEGFGSALLAAGIPMASKIRLPANVKLPQVLGKMYDDMAAKYPTPPTKDQWVNELLTNMSITGRNYPSAELGAYARPLTSLTERGSAGVIPRTQQAAAVIDMADRYGLLNAEKLGPMINSSMSNELFPQQFKNLPVSQSYIDLLRNYLDLVKP